MGVAVDGNRKPGDGKKQRPIRFQNRRWVALRGVQTIVLMLLVLLLLVLVLLVLLLLLLVVLVLEEQQQRRWEVRRRVHTWWE